MTVEVLVLCGLRIKEDNFYDSGSFSSLWIKNQRGFYFLSQWKFVLFGSRIKGELTFMPVLFGSLDNYL